MRAIAALADLSAESDDRKLFVSDLIAAVSSQTPPSSKDWRRAQNLFSQTVVVCMDHDGVNGDLDIAEQQAIELLYITTIFGV
jgi:hypothetical protein